MAGHSRRRRALEGSGRATPMGESTMGESTLTILGGLFNL